MGFEQIYKQTVTVFNRVKSGDDTFWYPTVIPKVHLITDRSIIISTYGEQSADNAKLHIRYTPRDGQTVVNGKTYLPPKQFRAEGVPGSNITFAFGDDFDFIMEGAYAGAGPIDDAAYKNGFYNYMNKTYDNVFAISGCSKFNLLPHFEISAR